RQDQLRLGRLVGGRKIVPDGEIIMHKQPAELHADELFGERKVGQVGDDLVALLDAVGVSLRGWFLDDVLIIPARPGSAKAGGTVLFGNFVLMVRFWLAVRKLNAQ